MFRIFWVQSMSGFLVRVFCTVKEFCAGLNEIEKNKLKRTQLLTTVFRVFLCSFIYAPDISTCIARLDDWKIIQVVFTVFELPLFVSVKLKNFSGSRSIWPFFCFNHSLILSWKNVLKLTLFAFRKQIAWSAHDNDSLLMSKFMSISCSHRQLEMYSSNSVFTVYIDRCYCCVSK